MNEGFFLGEAVRDGAGRMVDFLFVEMNPAFEKQTGIAIADASGRTMREVVPGIPDELIDTYAKVVDTGEPTQFEVHVPVMEMWFDARARKVEGDRFAVLFLDATERKRAELAVAASAARFRSAWRSRCRTTSGHRGPTVNSTGSTTASTRTPTLHRAR